MTDIATLGIKIESGSVATANQQLDGMSQAAQKLEARVKSLRDQGVPSFTDLSRATSLGSKAIDDASGSASKLGEELNRFEGKVQSANSTWSNFSSGLARGALGAGVGAIFGGLIASAVSFKNELIEIDRVSRQAGLTLAQVSGLQSVGRGSGLTTDQVNAGVRSVAESLNSARREENELTKLLEANNIAYQTRNGQVISTNTALEKAAVLISNAATELDKVDIARKLGLSEEWVKILEKGPIALRQAREEAEATGAKIDQSMVNAAKEFDKAWAAGWESFTQRGKSALLEIGQGISNAIASARALAGSLTPQAGEQAKYEAAGLGEYYRRMTGARGGSSTSPEMQGPVAPLNRPPGMTDAQFEILRRGLQDPERMRSDAAYVATFQRNAPRTVIPSSSGGGGGSSAPTAEEEDALQKEIQRLSERTAAIQTATNVIGLNTFEREKALATQRLTSIANREEIELTAGVKAQIDEAANAYANVQTASERAREEQQRYQDVLNTGRGAFSGFFTGLSSNIQQGKNVWQSLADAATQSLNRILNKLIEVSANSVFDSIFGRQGAGGAFGGLGGGLFGNLFGGSGAGAFSAGAGGYTGLGPFMANGGVFGPGGMTAFANGGVVNGPTIFPFANGTGLMGEAGPEAIMPLKRGPGGSLGVVAHDGGKGGGDANVVINITNNSKAQVQQTETDTANGKTVEVLISDVVTKELARRGSDIRTTLSAQGGIRDARVRR